MGPPNVSEGRLSLHQVGAGEGGGVASGLGQGAEGCVQLLSLGLLMGDLSALQRWFAEPLQSTLILPARSLMQRLELQHKTVTRYRRVLSQERSGEPKVKIKASIALQSKFALEM